ncbi:MAG: thioredoxin [Gammaproteobacteria bacterium]|nr:MAG: thioredoxin [Gammaproteobacteria bacterium]
MKWLRIPVTLILLACWLPLQAGETRDPYKYFFQDTFGDFQEELETAREEGKDGILIFFEMDECPFCHRMKQTVLNRPEVQDWYRRHFRIFSVDIEGDTEITDFKGRTMKAKDFAFRENRVRATPVFAFFDLDGNRVFRYTGATSGPQEFMWMGEYVAGKHYKEMPFTRYKRMKRREARQKR